MNGTLLRWLILTSSILVTAYLMEGIEISGVFPALLTAAILGILNAFFRPIVIILTLPLNLMTLGLFTFLINAFMLKLASGVIPGIQVHGFWTAIFGSFLISLVSWLLNGFINERGSIHYIERDLRQ